MKLIIPLIASTLIAPIVHASDQTKLLRQPSISADEITYIYGGDVWVSDLNGNNTRRITSTAAVESEPHFSPDGKTIAFSSNRSGTNSVYTVASHGGEVTRLTWHASGGQVRGWTNDGKNVLFASSRDTAPKRYNRLWTVPLTGEAPTMLSHQWAYNGDYSPNGKQMVIDRMSRWDVEWRNYRGGQNTSLVVLDLDSQAETVIPNEKTIDVEPVWLGDKIYFLSDRDWVMNIWSYDPKSKKLTQITKYKTNDIKQLSTNGKILSYEQNGYLHTFDPKARKGKKHQQLAITVTGDFPWAEARWENVAKSAKNASLSPSGKRALFEARGEIFTVPVKHGATRNLTQSSDAADRRAIWSPKGDQIAWFSDKGEQGYSLKLQNQDGMGDITEISIGESKLAWEPTWSPDGKFIAFADDDVRIRIVNLAEKSIKTIDSGGTNLERGSNGLVWSPDSQWLAYAKTASNNFQQILVWSMADAKVRAVTNKFANSFSPAWDQNGKQLYFLASTDYGLDSGWANTSSMGARHEYAPYVINLAADEASPFALRSDDEEVKEEKSEDKKDGDKASDDAKKDDKKSSEDKDKSKEKSKDKKKDKELVVKIDFDNIERRILPLPMPAANYRYTLHGPKGSVFFAERSDGSRSVSLKKYSLKEREAKPFVSGVSSASISADSKKLLLKAKGAWHVVDAGKPKAALKKPLKVNLEMKLDRSKEWRQMFVEAWRYQRDYFYDPDMHGRDWNKVFERYEPLVSHVKHRSDLTYILDQVNGELSVGHSFVFGGDFPDTEKSRAGLLGADLTNDNDGWKISRIYTAESWNPKLKGPLDQPNLKVSEDQYIVGINGRALSANDNIYQYLDGTRGNQTTLHINDKAEFDESWQITVKPIASENNLRQRTWVEDNRRTVDKLSGGKLAYVWVPNTSTPGFVSFNRYYFAQQDKLGAVIDERFNGGGLLDDYMVNLMNTKLRAALTNEVPNGKPLPLPAGIKGPKVLLINELAGSGGDYFPWAFRQQKVGKLIGATTWGGLVKSSVHYALVDGGALTAPDNAVFDPINNQWVGENEGIAPDIAVYQDAKALAQGKDPQLERAVAELLEQLGSKTSNDFTHPKYPTPAVKK